MKNLIHTHRINTPYGEMIAGSIRDQLCLCDWLHRTMRKKIDQRIQQGLDATYTEEISPVIRETEKQLEEYFAGQRKTFTLPIRMTGTPFQQKVWETLLTIPFGKTITYSELAGRLGDQQHVRAVAAANGNNALSIIIPCHRVIGKNGNLTGYAGGINVKRKLILFE